MKLVGCYLRANDRIWGMQISWDKTYKAFSVELGSDPYGAEAKTAVYLAMGYSEMVSGSFLSDHAGLLQSTSFKDAGVFMAMSATQYQKMHNEYSEGPAFPAMADVKTLSIKELAKHEQPLVEYKDGEAGCFYFGSV
ncbi:MAG: hypothetical protein WCG27_02475 [Pseudomonadota bacterium]